MHASKRDTLEIVEFVPDSEVDPLHVEKTYYTGPDKGMDKGYKFLFEILKAYKRVAIGTWVSRGKEHLVAIRAHQHGLIMHQMFYNTEIRAFENKCSDVPISPVEMAMGKVLMDTLFHEKLDESKYRDKFIDKLMAAVQVKIDGGNIKEDSAPVVNSNITDALRSSLLAMGIKADQIDGMLKAQGIQESAEPFVLTAPKAKRTRTRKAS
jgi:DNA end-binding protein Ku